MDALDGPCLRAATRQHEQDQAFQDGPGGVGKESVLVALADDQAFRDQPHVVNEVGRCKVENTERVETETVGLKSGIFDGRGTGRRSRPCRASAERERRSARWLL